jgi:hypothetical protein
MIETAQFNLYALQTDGATFFKSVFYLRAQLLITRLAEPEWNRMHKTFAVPFRK